MPIVSKRSEKTMETRRRALVIFRSLAGDGPCDEDRIAKIFDRLEHKYSPSYCQLIYRVCRSEFDWWPRDIRFTFDGPVTREVMDTESIATMIEHSQLAGNELRARLFMATIYGLRRVELARFTDRDIDLSAQKVFVRTAKKGTQRYHKIPDCGLKILDCKINEAPIRSLTADFTILEDLAGIGHRHGRGWHSIRRALATELARAKADPILVQKFLRWGSKTIYEQYYVNLGMEDDKAIFEIHPFLDYWKAI